MSTRTATAVITTPSPTSALITAAFAAWDVLYRNSGYDDGFTTVGRELRAAGLGTWDYAKGVAGIDMYGFSALPGALPMRGTGRAIVQ